jgi:hypothetical protein
MAQEIGCLTRDYTKQERFLPSDGVDVGREVARLRPRAKPIEDAVLAFQSARLRECLGALHGNATIAASLLRARTLLRLNRADAALETLPPLAHDGDASHATIAETCILRAAALARTSRYAHAHDALAEAWVHVVSAANVALEAEFEYYDALLAWLEGRFPAAEAGARSIEALAVPDEPWLAPPAGYPVSLAVTRARALELRAFEAARNGRLLEQARLVRRGLAMLRDAAPPDRYVEASLLRNLAISARETGCVADAEAIGERVAVFEWTPDLAEQRYHIERALGWCRALAGDHVGALRRFREASRLAVTPPWQLFAVIDRAYLAAELGQHISAEEEVAHACELAASIDWDATAGEESSALLLLAQLVAKRDAEEATRLLERFREARKHASALAFGPLDPRLRGSESYARAQVALGCGDRFTAIAFLTDAFEAWNRAGSKWRAALAASDLARLGAGDTFARFADREIHKRPTSWLALRRQIARA